MSFSSRIKEELSRQMSPARHCQIAEIAAILSLCGRIQISGDDQYTIKIHTENVTVARKCFTLLKKTFNIETDISIRQECAPGKEQDLFSLCKTARGCAPGIEGHKTSYRKTGRSEKICPWWETWSYRIPAAAARFIRGAFLAVRLHQRSGKVLPL